MTKKIQNRKERMPVLTSEQHKNRKIRHTEYYDMQNILDKLYADSKEEKLFTYITIIDLQQM